jgi:hypothetical protein
MILKSFMFFDHAAARPKRVLVLRQAQDEDEFDDRSVKILILGLRQADVLRVCDGVVCGSSAFELHITGFGGK